MLSVGTEMFLWYSNAYCRFFVFFFQPAFVECHGNLGAQMRLPEHISRLFPSTWLSDTTLE